MTLLSTETSYRVKLLERRIIAERTISLILEKPTLFSYKAGQNIDLALIDQEKIDPQGCARTFSLASAPFEDYLEVAVRIRKNRYKQFLNEMPVGGNLAIDGPYGNFKLHDDQSCPAVFIAAGIGITPILSMLRQAAFERTGHLFTLFYINRYHKRAAYYDELVGLQSSLNNFNFIPVTTRTNEGDPSRAGETGYFDGDMLKRHVKDPSRPIYYIVGATSVIWKIVNRLDDIADRERIRVEDFTGF